jgi:succinate dehydrogenase/fumarate reductase iron-sulfur protein
MVVSRLHPPGDGDIVLPQRGLSVLGTSSWLAEDPDDLRVPEQDVQAIRAEGARLVPSLQGASIRAAWAAARPLVGDRGGGSGRELSRTFKCFDHAVDDGVEGLVTISGGKATTLRGMAELAADVVVRKLGIDAPCRTTETVLLPHTAVGRSAAAAPPPAARAATPPRPPREPAVEALPDAGRGPVRVLNVARSARGDEAPRRSTFVVPADSPRATVLDALAWARRHLDPSLDVRHGCFHASCGQCGMRVNGSEALACVTRLDDLPEGDVAVEPLRGLGRVSDLVTDLETLEGDLDVIGRPLVRGAEPILGGLPPDGIDGWTRFEDCIECGLCLSACPVAAGDPAYAGPAVLAAVSRATQASTADGAPSLLALVDGDQGAWRCHLAFACSDACPSGARPGEEIMRVRRALIVRHARHMLRLDAHPEGSA